VEPEKNTKRDGNLLYDHRHVESTEDESASEDESACEDDLTVQMVDAYKKHPMFYEDTEGVTYNGWLIFLLNIAFLVL
jgi:hypothetical protein